MEGKNLNPQQSDPQQLNPFSAITKKTDGRNKIIQPSESIVEDLKKSKKISSLNPLPDNGAAADTKLSKLVPSSSYEKVIEWYPPLRSFSLVTFIVYILLTLAEVGALQRAISSSSNGTVSTTVLVVYAAALVPIVAALFLMLTKHVTLVKIMLSAMAAYFVAAFVGLVLVILFVNSSQLGGSMSVYAGAILNFGFSIWTWQILMHLRAQ